MLRKYTILFFGGVFLICCKEKKNNQQSLKRKEINKEMFEHHYVAQDLPGEANWGYGCSVSTDFDNDGDLDYAFSGGEGLYWFENDSNTSWERHEVGVMPIKFLGATSFDVDHDGWQDIIIGGYWYRNSQNPKNEKFIRYRFDDRIDTDIHDLVMADMDSNNKDDLVMIGESEGIFWYDIPDNPLGNCQWERTTITLDNLSPVREERIHSGFFPNGIGDLDGDNDNDLVLPDGWMENVGKNGKEWVKHPLPFGKRGPYGLSSRSWITDLDKDGDNDIVMTDCDQVASRAAWLENNGNISPEFTTHFLPMSATGIRGSFHSLYVGDFDNDGDHDIFTCEQEDETLLPEGAFPRWYIWENVSVDSHIEFVERVILDIKIGGHDARVGDIDGDGDLDIYSKVWHLWKNGTNEGKEHGDYLENKLID